MKGLTTALSWIGGLLLTLLGILLLLEAWLTGALFIIAGMFLIPPIRTLAYRKTGKALKLKTRAGIVAGLMIAAIVCFVPYSSEQAEKAKAEEVALAKAERIKQKTIEFESERLDIYAKYDEHIAAERYREAVRELLPYMNVEDKELHSKIAAAREAFENQKRKARIDDLTAQAKTAKQPAELYDIYDELNTLVPNTPHYVERRGYFEDQVKAQERKAAELAARKVLIEKQFSGWDGSHITLTKVIKASMNDPDSYEHDQTRYADKGDHVLVVTQFRGRNGFGGMVRNSVSAKVDIDGNILQIIE